MVDVLLEPVTWIDSVIKPLKHEDKVFLRWRFYHILLYRMFHLHLEVVRSHVIQQLLPNLCLICTISQWSWIFRDPGWLWCGLEKALVSCWSCSRSSCTIYAASSLCRFLRWPSHPSWCVALSSTAILKRSSLDRRHPQICEVCSRR